MSWEPIDWRIADPESLDAGASLLPLWPMLRSAIAESIGAEAMCPVSCGELCVIHLDAAAAPTPLAASSSFEMLGTDRRGSWAALEPTKGNRLGGKEYTAEQLQQLLMAALDEAFQSILGEGLSLGAPLELPEPGTELIALRLPLTSVDGEEVTLISAYDAAVEAELAAHVTALQALAADVPMPAAPPAPSPSPSKPAEFKSPTIPKFTPGSTMAPPPARTVAPTAPAFAGVPTSAAAAVAGNGGGYGGYAGEPLPPPPANVRPASLPELSAAPGSGNGGYNIDLLLGVNLQVAVEIGRTNMAIRDVLALTPGSIVELDKLAGEKVDVLVNGRQVAQGEVVVVDENFGVRITDVASRQSRIQAGAGRP